MNEIVWRSKDIFTVESTSGTAKKAAALNEFKLRPNNRNSGGKLRQNNRNSGGK